MGATRTTAAARISFAALLALPALQPVARAEEPPVTIVLRASSAVAGPFVRLGEIADLPGGPARLRAYAADILLGFSPGPGDVRDIESFEVEARLGESALYGRFTVRGAPRTSVFLEGDGAAAARFPEKAVAHDPAPAKDAPGSAATRAGAASPRAATASSGRAGRPATPARQTLPARPGIAERSATAARPSAAARPASADPGAAERPAGGVAKGDTVVLRKVGRTVILEEPARVLEAGGPGDPIAVQNLRTGKQIRARVDGPGAATPLDEREVKSGGRGD